MNAEAENAGPEGPGEGSEVRLQKALADAGVGSRRYCESLIAEGRVKVTREQYQALVAFGKARGFNTKRSPGRR